MSMSPFGFALSLGDKNCISYKICSCPKKEIKAYKSNYALIIREVMIDHTSPRLLVIRKLGVIGSSPISLASLRE
jgi:hypothetical protein